MSLTLFSYSADASQPYHQVSNAMLLRSSMLRLLFSYLEMALNGPLDGETRDNLSQSYTASKVGSLTRALMWRCLTLFGVQSLLFTINDLLVSYTLMARVDAF